MALDFPASPNINDTYTFGGVTWTYDGITWKVLGRFQFTSSETDPIFTNSPSFGILQQNINNWNAAHGWGDHSTAGYITSFTENDPVFSASPVGAVTTTQVSNWDTAYGWGDHSSAGYLTSYTETQTLDAVLALGSTTARDITTTGKIYYSNNFANSVDLPSASTYHGMFAHVHAEGHGYFAHAGAWTQLLDTGSSLSELADVSTTAPNANDVLAWDGSNWAPSASAGGGGGASVTISDTAPGSANPGDLWWESDKGRLKIYYNDTDSTQWVDASPPLASSGSGGGSGTTTGNFSGTFTGNVDAGLVTSDSFVKNGGTSSEYLMADGSVSTTLNMGGTMTASILPDTNAAYDLGSAEYKIRHLYLSQNTLYYEGEYLKVAQHNAGQGAGQASYMLPLSKIKEVLNASTDFDSFKAAMLAIVDAG